MQYIQKYFAYFACFYLFIMSIVQLFLLMYVASFTVVNFFLCYYALTAGWWRFWVKNWWKLCLRKKQAPASLTAKQNSVKTVSFLPHVWRENGQSSKYGRRRQIWTKPGKKYYTFIMKWWRTTSRIGKKNCLRGNLTSAPQFLFS